MKRKLSHKDALPKGAILPLGIRYSTGLNSFTSFVMIVAIVVGWLILVPISLIDKELFTSIYIKENPLKVVVLTGVFLVVAFLLRNLNKRLKRSDEFARKGQIILSLIGIVIGGLWVKLLWGISLYFMLFDVKTKEAFSK